MILNIRIYGDPCLREMAVPVKTIGPAERMLIASMFETMYKHKGVGLAAPQVGVAKRIFVADDGKNDPMVFINSNIVQMKGREVLEEGCLSIPDVNLDVERAQEITVEFIDQDGKAQKKTFKGLMARVIQHETDHLNGKMIIDYASSEEMDKMKSKLEKLEKRANEKK